MERREENAREPPLETASTVGSQSVSAAQIQIFCCAVA